MTGCRFRLAFAVLEVKGESGGYDRRAKAIDELKIDETFIKQVNEIEPEEALFEWEGLYAAFAN